jgi:hypothetical protein
MKLKSVIIEGIEYVPKQTIVEDYVIIRTQNAGVHAGNLISKEGNEVKLSNARRIWYWSGAASLSQLAVDGTSKPKECKFPCEVPEITLLGVIEIIPCTEKAVTSIKGVTVRQE